MILDHLNLTDGVLNPSFEPAHVRYSAIVGSEVSSTQISLHAPDGNAISVNGQPIVDGTILVNLAYGSNTLTVVVSRGSQITTYTITVIRTQPLAGYLPLPPVRLMDTRADPTTNNAKQPSGSVRRLHVTGSNGVPADATAVVLNVTATEADAPGFETIYPCGTAVPTSSNVNWVAHQTVSNRVIVALDGDGSVCLFSYASTHLVVDLNGAYSPTAGISSLAPLTPRRVLDTRNDGTKTGAGSVTELQLSGLNGIPADATAVVLNVTATRSQAPGFVTVFPCGSPVPTTSNVNFEAGQTIFNSVTATISTHGSVCLFTYTATDLVVDVNAAYSPTAGTAGFESGTPLRLLDTRDNGTKAAAGTVSTISVADLAPDATALVLNLTATKPAAPGFVTVYPCGSPIPTASNVNFEAGQTIPVSVTATVGADGKVCLFTYAATHLVVDLDGIYSPVA